MQSIFLSIVIVCAAYSPSEAVNNFLGPMTSFPLIHWTGEEVLQIFKYNQTLWRACVENDVSENLLKEKRKEMKSCLFSLIEKPGSRKDINTMKTMCRNLNAYFHCMETGANAYKDECSLNEEDQSYLEDSLENNKVMMTTICEDEQRLIINYMSGTGRACATNKSEELIECADKHKRDNMRYDEEGCMEARNYVRCADFRLSECDMEKAKVVREILDKGLLATNCKEYDPTSSASSIFMSMVVLVVGITMTISV